MDPHSDSEDVVLQWADLYKNETKIGAGEKCQKITNDVILAYFLMQLENVKV
jgi:hypothetical protein